MRPVISWGLAEWVWVGVIWNKDARLVNKPQFRVKLRVCVPHAICKKPRRSSLMIIKPRHGDTHYSYKNPFMLMNLWWPRNFLLTLLICSCCLWRIAGAIKVKVDGSVKTTPGASGRGRGSGSYRSMSLQVQSWFDGDTSYFENGSWQGLRSSSATAVLYQSPLQPLTPLALVAGGVLGGHKLNHLLYINSTTTTTHQQPYNEGRNATQHRNKAYNQAHARNPIVNTLFYCSSFGRMDDDDVGRPL